MFTTQRFAKLAGTALIGAGLTIGALATAGTASAGAVDDDFLSELTVAGIGFDNPAAVVDDAYIVCDEIDQGVSPYDIRDEILSNSDLTVDQANVFVVASVEHYCPEFL